MAKGAKPYPNLARYIGGVRTGIVIFGVRRADLWLPFVVIALFAAGILPAGGAVIALGAIGVLAILLAVKRRRDRTDSLAIASVRRQLRTKIARAGEHLEQIVGAEAAALVESAAGNVMQVQGDLARIAMFVTGALQGLEFRKEVSLAYLQAMEGLFACFEASVPDLAAAAKVSGELAALADDVGAWAKSLREPASAPDLEPLRLRLRTLRELETGASTRVDLEVEAGRRSL